MLRLLFYVLLGFLLAAFVKRFVLRGGGGAGPGRASHRRGPASDAGGLPKQVVCGACGHEYDPQAAGWLCPKCGK